MTGSDTGLDLLPFLRLLRADMGVWISLGAILLVLGLMTWTSWGSRRALRKCLVLSILAHVGLLVYGGGLDGDDGRSVAEDDPTERIQSIRVLSAPSGDSAEPSPGEGASSRNLSGWDQPRDLPGLDRPLDLARADAAEIAPPVRTAPEEVAPPEANPPDLLAPEPVAPEPSPILEPVATAVAEAPAPAQPDEIPEAAPPPARPTEVVAEVNRTRIDRPQAETILERPSIRREPIEPLAPRVPVSIAALPPMTETNVSEVASPGPTPLPDAESQAERRSPRPTATTAEIAMPDGDLRSRPSSSSPAISRPDRSTAALAPVTIARGNSTAAAIPLPLPAPVDRSLNDVPEAYRERLNPDRPSRARLLGASDASEQAVERALIWLARHQDADGRWNAGKKRYANDDADVPGETNHTTHCPPGDICAGECFYYEADTAMTGLALLAYLGAGYTHRQPDGKYTAVVAKGLQYLLLKQRADGDLRGESRAVGMYCHAMATLAVCEAYAMTKDERLRRPAEKAVDFLIKARAEDGLSWRYAPGSPVGDTSVLGWAILALKSADSMGIEVPSNVRTGALGWLSLVAEGPNKGLAAYRPNEGPYGGSAGFIPGRNRTPTMTAEAWACRQFLKAGGPGLASDEAAAYLLQNPPSRETYNLYYWYYGTLAMFQRGGSDWDQWNRLVRDDLLSFQKTSGHEAGSWDPRDSKGRYDIRGGRIYCTALAAMTLEVYYRYGRPGEENQAPRMAPASDAGIRRTVSPTTRTP